MMGAKTWMLVSADGVPRPFLERQPALDRAASLALAERLFPESRFQELEDGDISYTNPPDDQVFVGHFGSVAVVAAAEFGIDFPSQLARRFIQSMPHRTVVLHAMHSVVDWFAFAIWEHGQLQRALSLSPDSGVLEDLGAHLDFETPYWNGEHPVDDEDSDPDDRYPLPFHPLDLGEDALAMLFGYVIEGAIAEAAYDPEEIPLMTLKRLP